MITILPSPGPDVVAFRAGGKITKADIEEAWVSIDAALDEAQTIGLYAEVDHLSGFTLDGFLEDLRRGVEALGQIRRFARLAVVADAAWIRGAARVEGAVLPGVEVRTYTPDEKEAAMAWLTAHAAPLPGETPS